MKSIVTPLMVALITFNAFVLAFNIQPVRATGTIYIRADGSIDPPTAPITTLDNVTYTFADNIYDSIAVERDNIVIDGAGYTLQGTGVLNFKGIDLTERSNVTVKNTSIKGFYYGIWLNSSSDHNRIRGNNITNNYDGIYLLASSNNSIIGNHIAENNWYSIALFSSSNSTISGNNITNNYQGIWIASSSNSSISGNIVKNNSGNGILLCLSSNSNTVSGNNIANNTWSIYLSHSSDNTVSGNNVTANKYDGIYLLASSNNSIIGNDVTANNGYGVRLSYSSNNVIYHNNFINNTQQVDILTPFYANVWDDDYPSGGNYWSDYIVRYPDAEERDGSGIWNTPYVIDAYNQDNYPLMEPHVPAIAVLSPENKTYAVNSDIPLTFTVDKPVDWISYSLDGQGNVTISGNSTLPTIVDGPHYVVVYANDTSGNMGASNMVHFTVDITPPVANAGADRTVDEDASVAFDGSGSSDNLGIVSYEGDFGEGSAGTGKTVTHEYTSAGEYSVTLTVKDAAGNHATDTMMVTVVSAAGFPTWGIAAAGVAAAAAIAALAGVYYVSKRKKSQGTK